MVNRLISINDIETIIKDYKFLSQEIKDVLSNMVKEETSNVDGVIKENLLRNIYNIFSIASKFKSEDIFKCGRLVFKDDNELIFSTIASEYSIQNEIMLFRGCSIAKGDGSSYIILNNEESDKNFECFDFNKLVRDAVTPPRMTIVINIGYYPTIIEEILASIR